MDSSIQVAPSLRRRVSFVHVAALSAALLVGAAAGSTITRAVADDTAATFTYEPRWDQQKLDAMAGRMRFVQTPAPQAPWDQAKIDALTGRLLAG